MACCDRPWPGNPAGGGDAVHRGVGETISAGPSAGTFGAVKRSSWVRQGVACREVTGPCERCIQPISAAAIPRAANVLRPLWRLRFIPVVDGCHFLRLPSKL